MWAVKKPKHYSKRVGREVSGCCGCPLCCSFWVGALHRDNLMHGLSPLDRNVQEKKMTMTNYHEIFEIKNTVTCNSCHQYSKQGGDHPSWTGSATAATIALVT